MSVGKPAEFVILFLLTSAFVRYGLVRWARSLLSGLYLKTPDEHFTPIPSSDKPSLAIGAQAILNKYRVAQQLQEKNPTPDRRSLFGSLRTAPGCPPATWQAGGKPGPPRERWAFCAGTAQRLRPRASRAAPWTASALPRVTGAPALPRCRGFRQGTCPTGGGEAAAEALAGPAFGNTEETYRGKQSPGLLAEETKGRLERRGRSFPGPAELGQVSHSLCGEGRRLTSACFDGKDARVPGAPPVSGPTRRREARSGTP